MSGDYKMDSFLSKQEIVEMGFKNVGKNVLISRKASVYSPQKISIGSNVRIDDFCVLSGTISIGNYVHIAVFSAIFGGNAGVEIHDFANLSSRVSVYALSDDYSGASMTNPMVPDEFKNVTQKKVVIGKHVIIGASSVVLVGAFLSEGASFGAFSLINSYIEEWTINVGIPCKKIKDRSRKVQELEKKFYEMGENNG